MNKDKQLKQTIKNVCNGIDSAAMVSVNKDGSLKVIKEECSEYSFIVRTDGSEKKDNLLIKFNELGYLVDLDTMPGLTPCFGKCFLKVDVTNKKVFLPLIVAVKHFEYLRDEESILISDVLDNFEELVINKNKKLALSLRQNAKI